MAFFHSSNIGDPEQCFVAWVDLMGCKSIMNGPIRIAAQSIYKLHVAAIEAKGEDVKIYPLMDGFYVTSTCPERMKKFLGDVFQNLFFDLKNDSGKPGFQYLARGAVSYGEIYHGRNLPDGASSVLAQSPEYKSNILIGMPVVNSFLNESEAPPFGISVHESCDESFKDNRIGTWWKWFPEQDRTRLRDELMLYFEGKRKFPDAGYPNSKITVHEALASKYLENANPEVIIRAKPR